jgi:seryl-tRNA synthetase
LPKSFIVAQISQLFRSHQYNRKKSYVIAVLNSKKKKKKKKIKKIKKRRAPLSIAIGHKKKKKIKLDVLTYLKVKVKKLTTGKQFSERNNKECSYSSQVNPVTVSACEPRTWK